MTDSIINRKIYYTGIGSRETPQDILMAFTEVATQLSLSGFILRSGHAPGADMAFENGCLDKDNMEIYLPWREFNSSKSSLIVQQGRAFELAEYHHTHWHNLSAAGKKLQARNSHQVLGKNLDTPSDFVICWTRNGREVGGTAQAIRIAKHYDIPVFNFGDPNYSVLGIEKAKELLLQDVYDLLK